MVKLFSVVPDPEFDSGSPRYSLSKVISHIIQKKRKIESSRGRKKGAKIILISLLLKLSKIKIDIKMPNDN